MAIDMFLKVEGVIGESKDSNHTGWTDITSFSWGASQPGNMSVGGGGGAGKVNFKDLQVNGLIDKSTTALLKHCSSGKHLNKVELSVCKAGGQQVEYARITLEEVLVTSVLYTGAVENGDTVGVSYAFQSAKIKQQYWEQTLAGGKGAESSAGWNIKENKEA
ncbi:Hcp family T6SS protein Cts1H [Citrobacter freundii]|nr:Hcp family T6SS protein Cts1H [Citrobacter freundii]